MRYFLLAFVIFLFCGCDTNHKHPFFKPEISGAVYASKSAQSGDPTADDAADIAKVPRLKVPNQCFFTEEYGWTCTADEYGDLVDNDLFLATPKR